MIDGLKNISHPKILIGLYQPQSPKKKHNIKKETKSQKKISKEKN